jgi:hypothetical protein
MIGDAFMTCWRERFIEHMVVFCRYTNHDYEVKMDRTYRLDIRERRMYYVTGTNHVSPKIFGNCLDCEVE